MAYPSESKSQGEDVEIKDQTEISANAPSQSFQNIELITVEEPEEPIKVRSKLRLTAIMTALYVRSHLLLHTS